MGANEKYEAAMHGGEHDFGSADPVSANRVRFMSESELDRFIAKIRAEAKAEAVAEVANAFQYKAWVELIQGNMQQRLRIAQPITDWLRTRANQHKEGE